MKTPSLLTRAIKVLDASCKQELIRQGHSLTQILENSIKGKITGSKAEGNMLNYGFIVNDGTKPEKIPYNGSGKGSTKSSKYITALINYFKIRGLSEEEAKRAAFATANVQKKEGMSTFRSRKYSKSKQRQNFLDIALTNATPKVDSLLTSGMEGIFEKEFSKQKNEIV